MSLFPIVARELRVASRRRSLYAGRTVFALAAIFISGLIMSFNQAAPNTMGSILFYTLSSFAFVYCAMEGIWITSDCVSEEKREGTLGLLFLTDLSGYDVVFGKLAATSLRSFCGLLAILPVLAIPLLLGSVTGKEFGRLILVLINTMLLSLSVGICISVYCTKAVKSAVATFAMMIVLLGAGPICLFLIAMVTKNSPSPINVDTYSVHSAIYGMSMVADRAYLAEPWSYWKSLITNHVFIWVFIVTASLAVSKCWQDRPFSGAQLKRKEKLLKADRGSKRYETRLRERLFSRNPVIWLHSRSRLKKLYPWLILALSGVLGGVYWVCGNALFGSAFYNEPSNSLATAYFSSVMLKCWIGIESSQRLTNDRRNGSLELLFSTPLRVKDILNGHWKVTLHQFLGPLVFVCLLTLFFALPHLIDSRRLGGNLTTYMALMFLAYLILLVVDSFALFWCGLWNSLRARHVNRAIGATLFHVLIVPWILFLGFIIVITVNPNIVHYFENVPLFIAIMWFSIGLGYPLWLISSCRRLLNNQLRLLASTKPGLEKAGS
ncbi:MAG: ABC transporter permease [Limisphaerales bacterium]|tara:strand:- start:2421 stop:4070 length:1650 start_codon:yes stop_codon:yes gene_type:complete